MLNLGQNISLSLTSLLIRRLYRRVSISRHGDLIPSFRALTFLLFMWLFVPVAAGASLQPEHLVTESSQDITHEQGLEVHASEGDEHHDSSVMPAIARLVNFTILVGVVVYFLKSPIGDYLKERGEQIRAGLVEAKTMRADANEQLAEIDRQESTLPKKLEALKIRGQQEVEEEAARLVAATKQEKQRLLKEARREIDIQLRVAKRALITHAANVTVEAASKRIVKNLQADDQLRLVDAYLEQVKENRQG